MIMEITYRLRTDNVSDEEGVLHTVYGIDAFAPNKNRVASVADVFFDKQKAEDFIESCNVLKLSLVHLPDVIEDVLE